MKKFVAAGLFALASLTVSNSAKAALVVTITEVGDNVEVSGNGTINLIDLTFFTNADGFSALLPSSGVVYVGSGTISGYTGASDIAAFGTGSATIADSSSGQTAGFSGLQGMVIVPVGYVSGSLISNTAAYLNQSFATLGLESGIYVSTWGSGENADSLTINVAGVPEPATAGLLALGGCVVLFRSRRRG